MVEISGLHFFSSILELNDLGFVLVVSDVLLAVLIVAFTAAAVSELHIRIILFCYSAHGAFMYGLHFGGILGNFDVPAHPLSLVSSALPFHETRTKEQQEVQ